MYLDFYNLVEKPFNLTPSPRFLHLGESHREALALLTYGVVERKGFILLTGEVGTGKTTMVQALLSRLDENVECISLSNPLLSTNDFMDFVAFSAFKRKVHFRSKSDFLLEFESYLRDCLRQGRTVILIIDEAHTLSFELLEEIRLLSNMELADEKLINIFLIGQPELNEKLSDPRCRALLQRISSRHHIRPMDENETRDYVEQRLRIAGAAEGDEIFSKGALKALRQYGGGYPRMVNILADNALLLGYAREKRRITASMVKQCFDDMSLEGTFLEKKEDASTPEKVRIAERRPSRGWWKWIAAALLVCAVVIFGVSRTAREKRAPAPTRGGTLKERGGDQRHENETGARFRGQRDALPPPQEKEPARPEGVDLPQDRGASRPDEPEKNKTVEADSREGIAKVEAPSKDLDSRPIMGQSKLQKGTLPTFDGTGMTLKPVIVEEGDTVARLANRYYGRANRENLDLIRRHNPDIKDIDRISVGQKIFFPLFLLMEKRSGFTVHIASFKPFEEAKDLCSSLEEKGYDAYLLPQVHSRKGTVFRVTLGRFETRRQAEEYAGTLLKKGISTYAIPVRMGIR